MTNTDAVVTIKHNTPHHLYLALGAAVVLVLSVGVGIALYELALIEGNVNKSAAASAETLAMVNQALKGTHKNGDDGLLVLSRVLLQNADSAANALKQTMQDANKIAKAEEPKTVELADSSIALIKTAGGTVTKLGEAVDTLNGVIADVRTGTLPKLNTSVDSLNGLVGDLRPTAQASTALVTEATGAVTELKGTVIQANALLALPDLTLTIHNFASTSAHLDGAAANGEQLTGEFRDMFKPSTKTSFWETLAMSAAKAAAGPVAGSLITHFWPQKVTIGNPITVLPSK